MGGPWRLSRDPSDQSRLGLVLRPRPSTLGSWAQAGGSGALRATPRLVLKQQLITLAEPFAAGGSRACSGVRWRTRTCLEVGLPPAPLASPLSSPIIRRSPGHRGPFGGQRSDLLVRARAVGAPSARMRSQHGEAASALAASRCRAATTASGEASVGLIEQRLIPAICRPPAAPAWRQGNGLRLSQSYGGTPRWSAHRQGPSSRLRAIVAPPAAQVDSVSPLQDQACGVRAPVSGRGRARCRAGLERVTSKGPHAATAPAPRLGQSLAQAGIAGRDHHQPTGPHRRVDFALRPLEIVASRLPRPCACGRCRCLV